MSYCRWSSDNSKCDIYAYEAEDGFYIHVANMKIVGDPPVADISLVQKGATDEYMRQYKDRSKWMDAAEYVCIGLPFDGKTFVMPDIEEFYRKMKELKEIGYHIPEGIIESIEAEIKETPPAQ